jgi:phytoene synthase
MTKREQLLHPSRVNVREDSTLAPDRSTFAPGLRLLAPALRADARSLYVVLRTLDDLVDEKHPGAAQRVDAVERWAREGAIESPEAEALAELALRHPLPRAALIGFCTGMRHDIACEEIHTEADLERYCQHVGGTVGIMLASLLGTCHPDGARKMATLGRALQRTNILRDIDEDLANGHVYIAQSTIERFGFPTPGAREDLLRDQIACADALYTEGMGALGLLRHGQRGMSLAAKLYREILRQIEREGFGVRPGRVVVPAWRKRILVAEHRLLPVRQSPQTPTWAADGGSQ